MKAKTKIIAIVALALIAALALFSCASVPSARFPADGIYSYDFERYVDCVEATYAYKAYGLDAYQNIRKKSWGNAVYMQNGSFVEPETRIVIEISPQGEVTSPQNPSITGTYKRDGEFFFHGYYEENAQVVKIDVHARLLPSDSASRADSRFDGDFVLTDNGTGRKQNVKIEDGLFLWEYAEKEDGDFATWPVIVGADGAINCGFEMTVHSGVKGLSDMLVSSRNESVGKVSADGIIELRTLTENAGAGQAGEAQEITFTGIRGTENFNQISKEYSAESKIKRTLATPKNTAQNQPKENPPDWYADFISNDDKFLYGSARKTHGDKGTALKIAEITAAREIRSVISAQIFSYSEGKKTMAQGRERKDESSFFSLMDSFAYIDIPYTVKNSFYDEKTKTAYVVVALSREEARKFSQGEK